MKKLYNSKDLSASMVCSKFSNKYNLSMNIFQINVDNPFDIKSAINKFNVIEKEVKKLSNDDIKNDNLNIISSEILDTEFFIFKNHSYPEPGFILIPFLECNFDSFSDYFCFFLSFASLAIVSNLKKEEEKRFNLATEYTLRDILHLAYIYYERDKVKLKKFHEEFEKAVRFLFNIDNLKEFKGISPNNLLFIYEFLNKENTGIFKYRKNIKITYDIGELYGEVFNTLDYSDNKLEAAKQIIKKVKKLSKDNQINLEYSERYHFSSIFELLYIDLIKLIEKNNLYIKQCKCCNKYFITSKANVSYCDRIQDSKLGKTCKDVGPDKVALIEKKKDYLINLKASISSKKAMDVKRHPDIPEYKANYDDWKPLAQQYLQDYKNGTLDSMTFEKWLNYTSKEKIKTHLKRIEEFIN